VSGHPAWLAPLLRPDAALDAGDAHAGRFEGLYGGVYDRVIQSDALRRLAPLAYGDAGPIPDLDGFAARVAASVPADGVLLDVPSGGGTLLPRLARAGLRGRVIEADLGSAMLARASRMRAEVPDLDVALLQADAQDLPLRDASMSAAVSLNGLHVMPDPGAFLGELGRVIEPGGMLWLVTLVSGGNRRADAVIAGGRLVGILPGAPPSRVALSRLVAGAGFGDVESLGGEGLVGLAATRGPA
jgi:SAM-dependent methyltransferase